MRIFHRDTTKSTNLDALTGVPGDVFTADYQTAGRGRLDHEWKSGRALNLMFSAVLDAGSADPAEVATLPLVAGLAIVKALTAFVGHAELSLKWPNDVLCAGRKLAGILCERKGDNVIVGVGVNVNETDFPPEIKDRATSLALATGRPHDREAVLAAVLETLGAWHERWWKQGFAALHGEFAAIDHLAGRKVSVFQTDCDPEPIVGVCGGIQQDGTLLVGSVPVFAGEAHVES